MAAARRSGRLTAAWELVAEKGKRGGATTGAHARMNAELVDAAHQRLGVLMLRRTKASVSLGLPPKTERLVFVPQSPLQHRAYRAVLGGGRERHVCCPGGHQRSRGGGRRPAGPASRRPPQRFRVWSAAARLARRAAPIDSGRSAVA